MTPAPLCRFSVTPSDTHNQIGPLWCLFLSEWACACSRPLWVSPTTSPVRLGVSSAAAQPPTGVFIQRFEALFPCTGALGCVVCHLVHQLLPRWPAAPLPTLLHNPSPHWVRQLLLCCESFPFSCLSPPLLPVWVSISSLSPGLLDFHTFDFLSVVVVVCF